MAVDVEKSIRMRIVVVTSLERGFASICLAPLVAAEGIEVAAVVLAELPMAPGWKRVRNRLRKIAKIGPLSAINGVRMRRWFGEDTMSLLQAPRVEDEAKRLGIPVHRVQSVNSDAARSAMREARADLGLSLGNSYIAESVFTIPRLGMVNVHHEILPDFQGAHSVIWQLHEGSREMGYTVHQIDKGIDTGKVLLLQRMAMELKPTVRETVSWNYARLQRHSAEKLVSVVQRYEVLMATAKPQGAGRKFTTPTLMQYLKIRSQHRRWLAEAQGKVQA
jgi:methionyl-tRNA formyltransferase